MMVKRLVLCYAILCCAKRIRDSADLSGAVAAKRKFQRTPAVDPAGDRLPLKVYAVAHNHCHAKPWSLQAPLPAASQLTPQSQQLLRSLQGPSSEPCGHQEERQQNV